MTTSVSIRVRFVFLVVAALAFNASMSQSVPGQAPGRRVESRAPRLRANEIDTDLSRVFIFVDKTGFGHQHGVVGRLKGGYLRVAKESAGKILFDMPSFRADTQEARRRVGLPGTASDEEQEQVTANMIGPSVLDVEQFPTALFAVASVRRFDQRNPTGLTQYALDGDFTLHGVTKRINVTATGELERGFLHVKGNFPLRQTDFGIRPFKKALGAVGVGDVLTVYGDFWIKQ
ncbi:MAG TPA: YceI family protein [Planctomycetaceae bacterium]|jgi:polyisoprenoid-binding protein YceI|nr:YceI family protein [Planctomycetaceae bacterium]